LSAVLTQPRLAFAGLGWIGRHRMEAIAGAHVAEIAYTCDVDTELSFDDLLAGDEMTAKL
jgi:hypothetical protein